MGTSVSKLIARLAVLTVLMLSLPIAASAGGAWFDTDKKQYDPGDEVTLKGVTHGGSYGWVDDGPFFGFLTETAEDSFAHDLAGMRLPLGELTLEESSSDEFRKVTATITFELPEDLEPGVYFFDYCNASCTQRLGDLIGGHIFVGTDADAAWSKGDDLSAEEAEEQERELDATPADDEPVTVDVAQPETSVVEATLTTVTTEKTIQVRSWDGLAIGAAVVASFVAAIVAGRRRLS